MSAPRIQDLATPALLVEQRTLEANLEWAAELTRAAGVTLCPHVKTHKSPDLARRQVAAGAAAFTTATVGEAEVFSAAGFRDLFVAYPQVGADRVGRLAALNRTSRVGCGLDHLDQVGPLAAAAQAAGVRIPVRLEVDSGHHRCGLAPGSDLVALGQAVAASAALELEGVYTHAGQAYSATPDSLADIGTAEGEIAVAAARHLGDAGLRCRVVSVGSSPTLPHCVQVRGVTEARPGNYVFRDATQVALGGVTVSRCALTVLTTVVTVHGARRCVLDAGSKVLGLDRAAPGGAPRPGHGLFPGRVGWTLARLSEEHGVVELDAGTAPPRVGERLRLVPNHACVAVNLASELVLVDGERVVDRWPVAARR